MLTVKILLTIQKEYIHYARLKGQCARKYEKSSKAYACIFMKRVTKLGEKLCCATTKIDGLVKLLSRMTPSSKVDVILYQKGGLNVIDKMLHWFVDRYPFMKPSRYIVLFCYFFLKE